MRDSLAMAAARSGGVFTQAEALEAGYTQRQIRMLLDSGVWTRLRHGVLVDADHLSRVDDQGRAALEIAAARRTTAQPTIGADRSAARALGLPLLAATSTVELIGARSARGGTQKHPIRVRAAHVLPQDQMSVVGVPVTTAARTLSDLAVSRPLEEVVVAGDFALHEGLVTVDELTAVAAISGALPSLMQVLGWLNGLSESPLESVSRIELHRQGIEEPLLQQDIFDQLGQFIGRVDFLWSRFRVIGEADGLAKYDDPNELVRQQARQKRLENAGYVVVRWTWAEITMDPAAVASRLLAAFAAAA